MARAKKAEVVTAEDQEDIDFRNAYEADQLNPVLEKLYAEMGVAEGGEANVYVTKLMPDGREAKIWDGPASDYDLMGVARKFGSGDYRVKIYVRLESGRFGIKANNIFPVLLEAGEDARLEALRSGQLQAQQTAANPSSADIARIVAEAVRAAIPAQPAQSPNNLGMLKEVAEIVRMLAPVPAAPQNQINPLDLLRLAADITRRDDSSDPIERGVNATGMDVFMRLVDKFAPMFADQLKNAATPAHPALSATVQSAGNGSQPAQPAAQSTEDEAMMKLKMGLSFLLMQAQADNDPGTYADVVLDNVPADMLAAFLAQAAPVDYLATINPEVRKHEAWFKELMEAVKEALKEQSAAGSEVDQGAKPA